MVDPNREDRQRLERKDRLDVWWGLGVEGEYEAERVPTGSPLASQHSLAQPWGLEEITPEEVQEAIGERIAGWMDLGSAGPSRLVLALPWHPLPDPGTRPVHVLVAEALAQRLAPPEGLRRTRRAVVLLDHSALEWIRREDGGSSLARVIALQQLRLNLEDELPADRMKVLASRAQSVANDLRAGRILVILQGVVDADQPDLPNADRSFCTEAEARRVFAAIKAVGVRHVVLVGRGSGRPGVDPVVAYPDLLDNHGFTASWFVDDLPHPVGPMSAHLRGVLGGPNGPAYRQILPLRLHPDATDPVNATPEERAAGTKRRLAVARLFLLGAVLDEPDGDERIAPALPRTFNLKSLVGIPIATWSQAELLAGLDSAKDGLVLIDPPGPAGGHGKSSTLLGIAAWRYFRGEPAFWISFNELLTWVATRKLRPMPELLTEMMALGVDDPAWWAQVNAGKPVLLLEGMNESVGKEDAFATRLLDALEPAIAGKFSFRVVTATRLEAWREDPTEQRPEEALPPPAQLRRRLGASSTSAMLELAPLGTAESRTALAQVDRADRFATVPELLLAHPFSLGALLILAFGEGDDGGDGDRAANLPLWEVADRLVTWLVREGLARGKGRPEKRPLDGPVTESGSLAWTFDQRVARTLALLDHLALSMAVQGTPSLRRDRALETVWETHKATVREETRAQVRRNLERLAIRRKYTKIQLNDLMSRDLDDLTEIEVEQIEDEQWESEAAKVLLDLQAVSLVFVGNEDDGYDISHEGLRNALSSRAWVDLEKGDLERGQGLTRFFRESALTKQVRGLRLARKLSIAEGTEEVGRLVRESADDVDTALTMMPLSTVETVLDSLVTCGELSLIFVALEESTVPQSISERNPAQLLDLIDRGLDDPDENVRQKSMRTLWKPAKLLMEKDLDGLLARIDRALKDPNEWVRLNALVAFREPMQMLKESDPKRMLERLDQALIDPFEWVRRSVMRDLVWLAPMLWDLDPDALLKRLDLGLDDSDDQVREYASEVLGEIARVLEEQNRDALMSRLNRMSEDSSWTVRNNALNAAVLVVPDEYDERLAREWSIESPFAWWESWSLKVSLPEGIASNPTRILDWVERGLGDADNEVRQDTLKELIRVGAILVEHDPKGMLKSIGRGLDDQNEYVRWQAMKAMRLLLPTILSDDPCYVANIIDQGLNGSTWPMQPEARELLRDSASALAEWDSLWLLDRIEQVLVNSEHEDRDTREALEIAVKTMTANDDLPKILAWIERCLLDQSEQLQRGALLALMTAAPALERTYLDRILKSIPPLLRD